MVRASKSESGPSSPPSPPTPRAPVQSVAPDSTDMEDFTWSCRCTNITINGKVDKNARERIDHLSTGQSDSPVASELLKVRVDSRGEHVKQSRYTSYGPSGESRGRERDTGDSGDEAWRRCTLCDVRVYKVDTDQAVSSGSSSDQWFEVALDGPILYGSRLTDLEKSQPALPFTGLRLPLDSKFSNFGRPPQTNLPQIYPPTSSSPTPSSSRSRYLIPIVHDPFFLPPPFIPSHPHLKDLCTDAVAYLQETHDKYEAEVLEFVAEKAREMRTLEDKVRCEVEMLWNAFLENDQEARANSLSRRGSRVNSRSKSREPVRRFSPSPVARTRVRPSGDSTPSATSSASATLARATPTISRSQPQPQTQSQATNPILNEAARNPAYAVGTSLLSASISANAYQAHATSQSPDPEPIGDVADESINRVSRTYGTNDDARAVAMSHVFSVLDDAMASKRPRRRSRSRSTGAGSVPTSATANVPATPKNPDESAVAPAAGGQSTSTSIHGKDSWIDHDRLLARGVGKEPTIEEESTGNTRQHTPRPASTVKEGKRTVKFQDQKDDQAPGESANGHATEDQNLDRDQNHDRATTSPSPSDRDDNNVFDLEMEGDGSASAMDAPRPKSSEPERPVDPFEKEISARYAAHAPSHRSAWKRPDDGQGGYSWYRKGEFNANANANTDRGRGLVTGVSDNEEQARISGLATSMPVHIALPKIRKPSNGFGLERKTSLSEKEGRLVPPLMAAMKQRGLDVPGTQGQGEAKEKGQGQGPGEGGRRVSTTVGTMDPGVLHDLETLDGQGDGDEDEDDGDGDGDGDEDEERDQQGTLRQSGFIPPHVIARNRQAKGVDGVRSIYDE